MSPEKKNRWLAPITANEPHKAVFLSKSVRDVQCLVGVKTMSMPLPLGPIKLWRSHHPSSMQRVMPISSSKFLTPFGTILNVMQQQNSFSLIK